MKNKIKKILCTVLAVTAMVTSLCTTDVQAATKQIRHHGTIQGVEYKANDFENDNIACAITLHNTNRFPVFVDGKVTFYSKTGKKLSDGKFSAYIFSNERTGRFAVSSKCYSDFEVSYKVKRVSNKEIKKERNPISCPYYSELNNIKFSDINFINDDNDNIEYGSISSNKKKFYGYDIGSKNKDGKNKVFYVNNFVIDKTSKTISFGIKFIKNCHYMNIGAGANVVAGVACYDKDGYYLGSTAVITPFGNVKKGEDANLESDEIDFMGKVSSIDINIQSSYYEV